jgi:hypothetical protein
VSDATVADGNGKGQDSEHASDPIVIILADAIPIGDPHGPSTDQGLGIGATASGASALMPADIIVSGSGEVDPSSNESSAAATAGQPTHGNGVGHDLHAAIIASLLPPLSSHHAHA